jgi:hypothetical protein
MSAFENSGEVKKFRLITFLKLKDAYDKKEIDPDTIISSDGNYYYFPIKYEDGKLVDYAKIYEMDKEYKYFTLDIDYPDIPKPFSDYLHHSLPDRKGLDKWISYFEVYDRYFGKYRGKPLKMLEIGIFQGGSLKMWKEYFGENASIVGIDINPGCKQYEEPQIDIRIGSQDDAEFLRKVSEEFGPFDIVLDDGGHMMDQQIISFENLFPQVKNGGVYLCEDVHTSYWDEYVGGLNRPGTFIEVTKTLIDHVNGWHIKGGRSPYTKSIKAIHCYDSIVVFEKAAVNPPIRMYLKPEGKYKLPD